MNNKYCEECKKKGIIKVADVMTEYGPLCTEHDLELSKSQLENLAMKRNSVPKINDNIFKFCKAN